MTLEKINNFTDRDAVTFFLLSCGSKRWADEMRKRRPFSSVEEVYVTAEEIWFSLNEKDWKQAFGCHPRIGNINVLRKKYQSTAAMASSEQSGVAVASEQTIQALAKGNELYEVKFGYIFIVCATGKSADEMLALLNARLSNFPNNEIEIAAQEQAKITRLRLEKLLLN